MTKQQENMEQIEYDMPEGYATEIAAVQALEKSGWVFDRLGIYYEPILKHPIQRNEVLVRKNHEGRFIFVQF
jgi:hypothetical protein